jgi:hypothetical protein
MLFEYDGGQFIPQYRLASSVRLVMYQVHSSPDLWARSLLRANCPPCFRGRERLHGKKSKLETKS